MNVLPLVRIDSMRIEVHEGLAGGKIGIIDGDTAFVSPAMFDLMKHANEDELQQLCKSIEWRGFPLREAMRLPNMSFQPLTQPHP